MISITGLHRIAIYDMNSSGSLGRASKNRHLRDNSYSICFLPEKSGITIKKKMYASFARIVLIQVDEYVPIICRELILRGLHEKNSVRTWYR
jgi:hypothetical protein